MMNAANLAVELTAIVGSDDVEALGSRLRVFPAAAPDVAKILGLALRERVKVRVDHTDEPVADDLPPTIAIDLGRMNALLHLDETSLLLHVQAGIAVEQLQRQLQGRGFSLGALPPWNGARTLGAALAAPRPSEASSRASLIDACVAVDAVLADQTLVSTRMAPRKATGPELAHVFLGARGRSGVITAAWMRLERLAPARALVGLAFAGEAEGFARAWALARRLLDGGARPARMEIVGADVAEPALGGDVVGAGDTLLFVEIDGVEEMVVAGRDLSLAQGREAGARVLAPATAERWLREPARAVFCQRTLAASAVEEAWPGRGRGGWLTAIRPARAALVGEPSTSPRPDPLADARAALYARLDPLGLFAEGGPGGHA